MLKGRSFYHAPRWVRILWGLLSTATLVQIASASSGLSVTAMLFH